MQEYIQIIMLLVPYMPVVYAAMAFTILSKALLVGWVLEAQASQLGKSGVRHRHSS